jgi:hypothetical protein
VCVCVCVCVCVICVRAGDQIDLLMDSQQQPDGVQGSSAQLLPTASSARIVLWEYDADDGQWKCDWQAFDQAITDALEAKFLEWKSHRQDPTAAAAKYVHEFKAGEWKYEVDVGMMTQTNVEHPAKTQRKVRRQLKRPGASGQTPRPTPTASP